MLIDYDEMAQLDGNKKVPGICWMDSDTHAPDIDEVHDWKVDLWGLCKMITEIRCDSGCVDELAAVGQAWLEMYPNLPTDLLAQVIVKCTD